MREIFKKYYSDFKLSLFLRDFKTEIEDGLISSSDINEWCNEQTNEMIENLKLKLDASAINKDEFSLIDLYSNISKCLIHYFIPSYETCKKIMNLLEKLCTLQLPSVVINDIDYSNSNLLEFVMKFASDNEKFGVTNKFLYTFISDNDLLQPICFFENANVPYNTKNRFTGFLACLYKLGYLDLFEQTLKIVVSILENNLILFPLIFVNLYRFLIVETKEYTEYARILKRKFLTKYAWYNWNKKIRSFITQIYFGEVEEISLVEAINL